MAIHLRWSWIDARAGVCVGILERHPLSGTIGIAANAGLGAGHHGRRDYAIEKGSFGSPAGLYRADQLSALSLALADTVNASDRGWHRS